MPKLMACSVLLAVGLTLILVSLVLLLSKKLSSILLIVVGIKPYAENVAVKPIKELSEKLCVNLRVCVPPVPSDTILILLFPTCE